MVEIKKFKISAIYIRRILEELIETGGLKFHKYVDGIKHYYVDDEIIHDLLYKDEIFKLDEEIIKSNFYLMKK